MSDPDTILLESEDHMQKAVEHLKNELRGVRTGRASPALIEFIKVECYGSLTDLKAIAAIMVPEPTQLLIKPFDQTTVSAIKSAIEKAGLGVNPMVEGKQLRIQLPPMTKERREKESGRIRKMGEEIKVSIRNVRRDANKHADGLKNDPKKHYPEDDLNTLKEEIQSLLKKFEDEIDKRVEEKCKEIMTI